MLGQPYLGEQRNGPHHVEVEVRDEGGVAVAVANARKPLKDVIALKRSQTVFTPDPEIVFDLLSQHNKNACLNVLFNFACAPFAEIWSSCMHCGWFPRALLSTNLLSMNFVVHKFVNSGPRSLFRSPLDPSPSLLCPC